MTDDEDPDDWFERALREADTRDDSGSDSADDLDRDVKPDHRDGSGPGADDSPTGSDAGDSSSDADAADESVFADGDSFGPDDPFGGNADSFGADDPFGSGDSADLADSFGADDPFGGNADSFGSDDPFGGYRGSSSPDDQRDDVGDRNQAVGESAETDTTEYDLGPEDIDSAIDRINVGIEGLDQMILGGVPTDSLLSVIGGAGTGKTTFALQFLNEALVSGETGVYITLEQTRESIFATAAEKGWSFDEHAESGRLAIVAIDPIEMANSLSSIRNDLVRLITDFDADRLVLDSVSLLEMMYDHPAKRRSEVFGFTRALKQAGVTTLLTSEASETNPYASRHGIVEYPTDGVFVLQYVRGSDFRETRLAVEIQKIRNANHSRQSKPYEITDTGIAVYGQANIF